MPTPRKAPSRKAPSRKAAAKPTSKPDDTVSTFVDDYGIEYVGGVAEVHVSSSIKPCINFQSASVECGFTFKTPADKVDEALPKAFKKVHDHIRSEIPVIQEALQNL